MAPSLSRAGNSKLRLADERTRNVLDLALPAVGEQVLNMLVGLADTFMVGHIGASAVAAVGLGNQIVMLVTTFFAAVATGVTALVARHIGAREPGDAESVLGQGYVLGSLLGIAGTILSLAFAVPAMIALRAPADVVAPSARYLSIVAITFVLAAWMFTGNAALRGAGDTRSPMLVMLAVNLVNIAVAYAFIYGPGPFPQLGVVGSALGAAAGRGAGGLLVTWLLLKGRRIHVTSGASAREARHVGSVAPDASVAAASPNSLRLRPRLLRPDAVQLRRLLNIGAPAGAEQLMMRLGQIAYATTVAALGTAAYAAHQIALQAESLSYMPGFGFAVAATTLVGQGLGAGDPGRAKADGYLAHRLALILMTLMGVVFFIFPEQIMSIFINDPVVIRLGVWPLRLVAFSQPMLATMMVLAGGLRGAGDTRATLGITAAGLWLARVPLAFLLTPTFGLVGAWIAMGVDLNLRGLGMFLRFRSGKWATIQV